LPASGGAGVRRGRGAPRGPPPRPCPPPAADPPSRRPRIWPASKGTHRAARSCLVGEGGGRMVNDRVVGELERFLAERADHLMRTAVLLTGSHEAGQDLLQAALERLIRHWGTLRGDPEGYLRRTLYNLAADGFRRQGRLQRKLALLRAGAQAPADPTAEVDLRDALVRILLQLPPRQRAVLVLKYWEQLSEAEIAALLGCSEGTVKSATSRGLDRLRELANCWHQPELERPRA